MKLLEKTKRKTMNQGAKTETEDEFMFIGAVFSSDLPNEPSKLSAFQNALGIQPCETVYLKKVNGF
ncbi:MAG: hypothetical protein HKP24_04245 [Croceitalea sp.]|nr:hypothetical protein [Croceitalea sp.]NNC34337.1 hypothetical protein [Croceitalea sp.]NNM17760.1 hypothetical protein [Croceitalea sp.]